MRPDALDGAIEEGPSEQDTIDSIAFRFKNIRRDGRERFRQRSTRLEYNCSPFGILLQSLC